MTSNKNIEASNQIFDKFINAPKYFRKHLEHKDHEIFYSEGFWHILVMILEKSEFYNKSFIIDCPPLLNSSMIEMFPPPPN